ncbi:hypothetical protein CCP4SC76_5460005 [Gammaproteobacteria bacterium]
MKIKITCSKNGRIIGTYHSHPINEAIPSSGDLKNAFYKNIELIYDVCGRSARLWQRCKYSGNEIVKELSLIVIH